MEAGDAAKNTDGERRHVTQRKHNLCFYEPLLATRVIPVVLRGGRGHYRMFPHLPFLSLAGVALVSFPLVMRFQLLPLSKTAFALRFPPGANVSRFPICVTTHQFLAGCVPPQKTRLSKCPLSGSLFYVQMVKLLWLGKFKSIIAGQV